MAPIKRHAHSTLDEDSDMEVGRSETESDHTASRKRRCTSNRGDINNDSESESTSDGVDDAPRHPFDSDNEAEYEILATQAVKEKYANRRENVAAESGILEQVTVRNFMCHEYLEYDLGPLINFICGKNGSGKSAILTAIVLCLGGRASSTNRGQSLKKFIKEGQEQAVISVKIKNQGDLAYLPEVYGRTIQVERHFNRSGASGFKIKSQNGQIRSTKKADLEEICDHFSLQIDNPMNVLSQDNARQFITSSSAAEKYKLFVKGVQLEQLDQDYRIIEDNLDNIETKLEAKRPDVQVLEQQMQRAKEKLTLAQRHDGIRSKILDYRRQVTWVQVEEQERIRDEYTKEIERADEKIAAAEIAVAELHNAFEKADRGSNEATESFHAVEKEVRTVQDEKHEEKAKYDEIKKDTIDAHSEQRNIRQALKDAEVTMNTKRHEIKDEQQRLTELDGGGAAARLVALEEAKELVKEAQRELAGHRELKVQLDLNFQEAGRRLRERDEASRLKKEEVDRQRMNLETYARDRSQQSLAFHPKMPSLLKAIQEERAFAQRPIGPVGKHVHLLKPQWSSILEKSFGSTLSSFIVTSKKDMHILNGIMTKVGCTCPVIIGNNQRLNTTPYEPDESFDTTLRVLEIDNDLVRKHLVIQHGIDQTILIADMDEASRVLYRGSKPRNVKRCYCIDTNNKRRGYMLSFTRLNEASQDPISEFVGRPRMNTDIEAQVRLHGEALEDTKNRLLQAEQEFREAREKNERAKQALVRHRRREEQLVVAFQQAEDKVEQIKDAIDGDSVEGGKLEVLRAALSDAENAKTLHEGSYQDSVIALDAKKEQLAKARAGLEAIDERIAQLQGRLQKASDIAQKATKKRAVALGEKNAAIGRIDDGKADRGSLQRKREGMETQIENFTAQAREISERVNIDEGETYASLTAKFNKLEADYKRYQRQLGATMDEIAAEAARTVEAFRNGKRDIEELDKLGWKLKTSLIERRQRWEKFRSFISCRAKAQFTYLLSERSFRGEIITDHKQKLLELKVQPDITYRNGEGRLTNTLSGGEKSFSQICLLLSIWEAMGSPIRCLDEFDVYMDAVNRSMSVHLLIEGARRSVGRQFILISPGAKSDIPRAPDVNVKEMPQAERGQTRLPY